LAWIATDLFSLTTTPQREAGIWTIWSLKANMALLIKIDIEHLIS